MASDTNSRTPASAAITNFRIRTPISWRKPTLSTKPAGPIIAYRQRSCNVKGRYSILTEITVSSVVVMTEECEMS